MKFVELAKSLKEKILPAYYIEGEEAHFRDHAVESIRAALSLAQPALNDMRIEGETLKGEKLYSFRDALYTAAMSFLRGKTLVDLYSGIGITSNLAARRC